MADRISAAVAELVPTAAPVRPVAELRKGRSHYSWLLDSAHGQLVGKVSKRPPDSAVLERLAEHRRVIPYGVPVPLLLGVGTQSRAFGERLIVVAEYLPGVDAEEAFPVMSDDQTSLVMRDVGAALAALHQVPVAGFGEIGSGLGSGTDSWAAYVGGRIDELGRPFRFEASGDAALVSTGLALLGHLVEEISAVVRPAVAHLDVYLPNLLLDDSLGFRALLDLEHLRWVDPVMDFVKPAMWIFKARPELAGPFSEGYRSAAGWPERWRARLSVATGLELLTGIKYWTDVGDHAMLTDYRRQLAEWVRSDGAWAPWPTDHS